MDKLVDLPLNRISPDPNQPRKYFNEESLSELASSIKVHGLLQPILCRPWNGDYQLVHGERRFRACQRIGLATIKAFVKELSDKAVADIQLAENIERDNLSDIELGWEFNRRVQNGETHEQIAEVINRSRGFVTQRLALLKLPKAEQERMLKGELSFSNARYLLSIKDPNLRERLSKEINEETTVKQTLSLLKPEDNNVTRVTFSKAHSDAAIDVRQLAVYKVIIHNEKVNLSQLIPAYVKDLKTFRGGF